MCGRSSPAAGARQLLKLRHRRGRSHADWLLRGCSRTFWFRSMRTTARSIVRRRFTRGRESNSIAPRWPDGSEPASELLAPLVDAVRRHVLGATRLHADDTPVPVLAPGNGKTKTGRLWTYVRDDRPSGEKIAPAVWFAYSPDRRGEHPREHLNGFHGNAAGRRIFRLSPLV